MLESLQAKLGVGKTDAPRPNTTRTAETKRFNMFNSSNDRSVLGNTTAMALHESISIGDFYAL